MSKKKQIKHLYLAAMLGLRLISQSTITKLGLDLIQWKVYNTVLRYLLLLSVVVSYIAWALLYYLIGLQNTKLPNGFDVWKQILAYFNYSLLK